MYCPQCTGQVNRTDYLPTEGLEPNLREYKCKICCHIFYAVTGNYQKPPAFPEEQSPELIDLTNTN